MNILYAYKECEFGGGAEKHFIDLANYFSTTSNIFFIISGGYLNPIMKKIGKILYYPSRGNKLFFAIDFLYLIYIIKKNKIDIVHAHHRYPAFIISIIKIFLNVKFYITVHNVYPDKSTYSLWNGNILAVSKSVESWLINKCKVKSKNIDVIYNGIKSPKLIDSKSRNDLKTELNLSDDDFIFISIGRLTAQKNYFSLINILSKIEFNNWKLLLIGEGEHLNDLKQYSMKKGLNEKILFLGRRNDINALMQISDIYLMTSLWEGFPYVIVEALANGLPIISNDVGGVSEAVFNGKNGFIIDKNNQKEFIEKINFLYDEDSIRKKYRINGIECFNENFQINKMFKLIESKYLN